MELLIPILLLAWLIGAIVTGIYCNIGATDAPGFLFWLILWPVVTTALIIEDFKLWRNRRF